MVENVACSGSEGGWVRKVDGQERSGIAALWAGAKVGARHRTQAEAEGRCGSGGIWG